jgi:glycosyltransferase involved in cell wall biosynthesis
MALAEQPHGNEVWLALSGAFPSQVEKLRVAFSGIIPQDRIVVYGVPTPCAEMNPANDWRARAAEQVRESFIQQLNPDLVFLPSLFEGWCDDSVTSVGLFAKDATTAVVLYDLIPFLRPDECLPDPRQKEWYQRKLTSMRSASILAAISESSRREAIDHADFDDDRVVNIGCGVDARFRPLNMGPAQRGALRSKYGINGEYVMYSGAIDSRKNLDGLIEAFALLPAGLRNTYQLVLVGSHNANERELVLNRVQTVGLPRKSVVFTGYVSDDDLIALYNQCALFVLPSFHEGFGLPAAEAMACGAPAIGSDATSIPEVIGCAEALFDPRRPRAIAAKMEEVLSNSSLRERLREHGLSRSKQFRWENSARLAWEAFEELHKRRSHPNSAAFAERARADSRKRLAYFSPIAPVPSGISDYSAALLPELANYYEIEVIAFQPAVTDAWVNENCPVRSPSQFETNASRYDRILYHIGNSPFHVYMWRLMERYPGTVVLHDFFQSNVLNWVECDAGISGAFGRAMYHSDGYGALIQDRRDGREAAIQAFPCNRFVLDAAAGVIVHSQYSVELIEKWHGTSVASDVVVIPMLSSLAPLDRERARVRLGFQNTDFVVCCFGMIADTKLNHRLLDAWSKSELARDRNCKLVFVGDMHGGEYGRMLKRQVELNRLSRQVQFTGLTTKELYHDYLAAADAAVQLRTNSRGETSKAVYDCLANGIPTIVNAHGSLSDLPSNAIVMVPDEFSDENLSSILESLRRSPGRREQLRENSQALIRLNHDPKAVAEQYWHTIERFSLNHWKAREDNLLQKISSVKSEVTPSRADLARTASAVAKNGEFHGKRQLLLDISATARNKFLTGIERVSRAITTKLIEDPPAGFRVEPVKSDEGQYWYARSFTVEMVGAEVAIPESEVEVRRGDVYIALDWSPEAICSSRAFFDDLRARGVKICFMVYDLLPLQIPHRFPEGLDKTYRSWLESITGVGDELIAISRAVADELIAWLDSTQPVRLRPLQICYSHLGADIQASSLSKGLPANADQILSAMQTRPAFVMVGTIEPRKGHTQVLSAFEQLWADGMDLTLVIVGKQGWMMQSLAERIRQHQEFGHRLFWLAGISDEMLLAVYQHASALIAASEGEGFGLPLIEAARTGVPLIVRDLPVFKEVAGEHAYYFSGETPDRLSSAVRQWLVLKMQGAVPTTKNLQWIGWEESTRRLMNLVMSDACYREWPAQKKDKHASDTEAAVLEVAEGN